MKQTVAFLAIAAISWVLPTSVSAQLVPCSGVNCGTCELIILANNVFDWLVGVLTIVFALIVVVSGIQMVTSTGSQAAMQSAKSRVYNAMIGFVIVLGSWVLVNLLMNSLADGTFGDWSTLNGCSYMVATVYHPTPNQSRGIANTAAQGVLSPAEISNLAASGAPDAEIALAGQAAGLTPEQIKNLQALNRVESAGCTNEVSPVGALGCMQIMPETAKMYDPSLRSLSDAQLRDKLLNDDAYNIQLGAKIYADLTQRYNGDERLVHAAYNGGPGANAPSSDCPGLRRWECEWDEPGCYGTSNTSCTPNTGYIETRNYVQKVADVASQLP